MPHQTVGLLVRKRKVDDMKIALIGYGKMGHAIERVAQARGHEVCAIIDLHNPEAFRSEAFRSADVAIEFTTPRTAVENIRKAWAQGVPVVCGTTGWYEELPLLVEEAEQTGNGLFAASNFSIGVNLFFSLNKRLAELTEGHPQYKAEMTEIHHIHKIDAPSGTAVTLAEGMRAASGRRDVTGEDVHIVNGIPVTSVREGEVPGTHIVRYESEDDVIEIRHEAKGREGFALGAVVAAEYMCGKKGFRTMNDLLKL